MKERLITYSAPMVRAKRAGLKTQTRRVIAPVQPRCDGKWPAGRDPVPDCPYGVPGDILVTREAWRTLATFDPCAPRDVPSGTPIWYEADGPAPKQFGRYRHARFMCRWMCRDRDEITNVRIERLVEISREDAIAEGCDNDPDVVSGAREGSLHNPRDLYACLWESINGPDSWDANPWVWVIEFRRVTS